MPARKRPVKTAPTPPEQDVRKLQKELSEEDYPARPRPGVYEPLGGEASEGFSTRSSIAQNIGCAEYRRL